MRKSAKSAETPCSFCCGYRRTLPRYCEFTSQDGKSFGTFWKTELGHYIERLIKLNCAASARQVLRHAGCEPLPSALRMSAAWHRNAASSSCISSGSWRRSSPSELALATSVAAHMHNLAEGRWYSSCSKTVRSEEWPEYVDCRNNSVPKFVPAKFCQLLYRRGPGGVLVVGDSLSDLFAATLAAMLADEAGPETASNRAHAIWPICSNRTLEYVRNDVLDTAQAYAGNPYAEYHAGRNNCGPEYHGVSSLLCNPWVDRVAAHSVVVLNTGAHAGFSGNTTITLAMFGDMMRRTGGTTRELAQLAVFPPHLFYRTAAAGHPGRS